MFLKAVYLPLGVSMAGEKETLGLWIAQTKWASPFLFDPVNACSQFP